MLFNQITSRLIQTFDREKVIDREVGKVTQIFIISVQYDSDLSIFEMAATTVPDDLILPAD